MAPRLQSLPAVDPIILEDGYAALENIQPYLAGDTEFDFHSALIDVIASLQASPASGYIQFIGVYGVWYELCHDSFRTFLDPDNLVAQLLLAYFVAVQLLMIPLAAHEWQHRTDVTRVRVLFGTIEWAQGIFERLDASGTDLKVHLDWPRKIIQTVIAEINGDVLVLPPVLQLHLAYRDVTPQSTIFASA
jgi:hypothetical protein